MCVSVVVWCVHCRLISSEPNALHEHTCNLSSGGMGKGASVVFKSFANLVSIRPSILFHNELATLLSKLFTIDVINNVYLWL